MPGSVPLVPILETLTGKVTGLYATSNPQLGIGGAIQIDGIGFQCLSAYTQNMLIVAASARQAGTPVTIQFWTGGNVIQDISG